MLTEYGEPEVAMTLETLVRYICMCQKLENKFHKTLGTCDKIIGTRLILLLP